MKNKLLLPTLSVVFPLMASPPSEGDDFDDEDEDDEVEEGTEASRPCAVASQVKCGTRTFICGTFLQRCSCQTFFIIYYIKVLN